MIPITQTKVVVRNSKDEIIVHGNCYAAVIASLLELPIEQVPNVEVFFGRKDGYWSDIMNKFLNGKGLELVVNNWFRIYHDNDYAMLDADTLNKEEYCMDKFYLVTGKSSRGVNHIVIYKNGIMVHDPHPTREGIIDYLQFEELIKINP